jgi:hypothetical protein
VGLKVSVSSDKVEVEESFVPDKTTILNSPKAEEWMKALRVHAYNWMPATGKACQQQRAFADEKTPFIYKGHRVPGTRGVYKPVKVFLPAAASAASSPPVHCFFWPVYPLNTTADIIPSLLFLLCP